jgi:hypothetical protein
MLLSGKLQVPSSASQMMMNRSKVILTGKSTSSSSHSGAKKTPGSLMQLSSVTMPEPKRKGDRETNRKIRAKVRKASITKATQAGTPRDRFLKTGKVKPATLSRCTDAVVEFEQWAKQGEKSIKTIDQVDKALVLYSTDRFEDGRCSADGSCTLHGWLLVRSNESVPEKGLLPRARQAIRGWKSRCPGSSRYAILYALVCLLSLTLTQTNEWYAAAAVMIQFFFITLLLVEELKSCSSDFVFCFSHCVASFSSTHALAVIVVSFTCSFHADVSVAFFAQVPFPELSCSISP